VPLTEHLLNQLPVVVLANERGRAVLLSASDKVLIQRALQTVNRCQSIRRKCHRLARIWDRACLSRSESRHHYSPRWTFPFFYFREPVVEILARARGLDVGARVRRHQPDPPKMILPSKWNDTNAIESFVPHFIYYSNVGCEMQAIDLMAVHREEGIEPGDARRLKHLDESLDFITAPILLGPARVLATPLEIAFCLSEFWRVLRPGGFVYLADAEIEPSITYTAQCIGFSCFFSKGTTDGIPVGTVLRRSGRHEGTARFLRIFEPLAKAQLEHSSGIADELVEAADLLWDEGLPTISAHHGLVT
jgi:hypothetical protein